MAVVKYDVSGEDHEKNKNRSGGDIPKPGVYPAVVHECTYEKPTNGKDPRVVVVYHLQNKENKGFPLWQYLTFGEGQKWSWDQFLQAIGIDTTKKEKGQFDTKNAEKKKVRVKIKHEAFGDIMRAKFGGVFQPSDEADEESDDEFDEDEDAEYDEEEAEAEESEEETGEAEDLAELGELADAEDEDAIARLTELAEEQGWDINDYALWADLAAALQEADAGTAAEDEEAGEDETVDYSEWGLDDIKAELESRGLSAKGPKSALILRLQQSDENPFE